MSVVGTTGSEFTEDNMSQAVQNPVPVLTTLQKGQLGIETTWGTAVAQTIKLCSVSLNPKPKISVESFTALGYRLPTAIALSEKSAEIGFDGIATYEEIGYFIKSLGSAGSVTLDSFTAAAGSKTYPGAAVSAYSLKGDNKSVKISGSMLAKWFNATVPTAGLSDVAQTPIDQGEVVIGLGTSAATALSRIFNWELNVSDIVGLARFAGNIEPGAATSPPVKATVSVEFEANATNLAFLANAAVGDVMMWQIACTKVSPAHLFQIAGKGKITEIIDYKDNEGVYGYGVKLDVISDGADGITVTAT